MQKDNDDNKGCCIFGVESGIPVIGLGILIILFGFIPFLFLSDSGMIPVLLLFTGFGIFLIWIGINK